MLFLDLKNDLLVRITLCQINLSNNTPCRGGGFPLPLNAI